MSAGEAADLIDGGRAAVTAVGDDTVAVVAASYFVPGPCGECTPLDTRRGTRLFTAAVSWGAYRVRHVVPRAALEDALGRSLGELDVDRPVAGAPISYDSNFWWLYAGTEALLLGLAFTLVTLVRRHLGLFALTVTAAALAAAFPLVAVAYSPAFFDSDFFYQRVLLELFVNPLVGFAAFVAIPLALELPRLKLALRPVYVTAYG